MQYMQSKYNKEGGVESILIINGGMLYQPDHPNAGKSGYLAESRVTAATALGHPLPKGAVVHHHRGEALVICQDDNYHKLLHRRMKAFDATGDPHKRKCSYCHQWDDLINLYLSPAKATYHRNCQINYMREWRGTKEVNR